MKRVFIIRKLIIAIIALSVLLYFVSRTASPKIIFVPFLICAIASIGKNLTMLFSKIKVALFFDILFKITFFLSWFIFLAFVCYIARKDGNYKLLLFTLPFWIGGLFFVKRKFFKKK